MSRAAKGRPKIGLGSFAFVAALGAVALVVSCADVDGVTPDCSDAAVCAPSEGDAASASEGNVVPEAAAAAEASTIDGEAELDADAAVDGG